MPRTSTSKFALVGLAEVLWHELAGTGVRACAVCPGDVHTDQLDQEHRWGPTGGVPPEKAMSPDYLAKAIVRSLDSRNAVEIVDKPHLRALLNLWGGPRRLRLAAVHGAYKELLNRWSKAEQQSETAAAHCWEGLQAALSIAPIGPPDTAGSERYVERVV